MRRTLLTVLLTGLLMPIAVPPAQAATHPRVLDHLGSTVTRAVIVTSTTQKATVGRATNWQKTSGQWHAVRSGMAVRLGRNGFSAHRHEGDGTTPAGNYGFVFGFGGRANPGVQIPWRPLTSRTCWSGERATYNRWVSRSTCTARDEDIWLLRAGAYRYAGVIDFNYAKPVWGKGSGIFLHVGTGRATAGCVSLSEADVLATLRWIRPGTRIVMGTAASVARL